MFRLCILFLLLPFSFFCDTPLPAPRLAIAIHRLHSTLLSYIVAPVPYTLHPRTNIPRLPTSTSVFHALQSPVSLCVVRPCSCWQASFWDTPLTFVVHFVVVQRAHFLFSSLSRIRTNDYTATIHCYFSEWTIEWTTWSTYR